MAGSNGVYGKRKTLPSKWIKAIDALMATPTTAAAAEACHVPKSTLERWLSLPPFIAEYQRRSRLAFSSGLAKGVAMTRDAFGIFRELMDYAPDPEIRLEACKLVMDYAFRAVELDELTARLDRLEQATGTQGPGAASPAVALLQQITSRMLPSAPQVPPAPPNGAMPIEEDLPPSGHGESENGDGENNT